MKSRGTRRELILVAPSTARLGESLLPDCPEERVCCKSCQAYRNGKCSALWDVHFDGDACPFYKDRGQARQERIEAMARLEDEGRDELIGKYYCNRRIFNEILANELVGVSYEFEDDGYRRIDAERRGPGRPRNIQIGRGGHSAECSQGADNSQDTMGSQNAEHAEKGDMT